MFYQLQLATNLQCKVLSLPGNPLGKNLLPGLHNNLTDAPIPLANLRPLEAKPLSGLLGAPKQLPGLPNKLPGKLKTLGPMKRMPGPSPEMLKTMMRWDNHPDSGSHGNEEEQQFSFRKQYSEGEEEEDLDVLVGDLQKTNAELERIHMIKQQFYG